MRYPAWRIFCDNNMGKYVIVYTRSGQRLYGWLQMASMDTEVKRDVAIGDPHRVTNNESVIPLGKHMLIAEDEILRILSIEFDESGIRKAI